MKGVMTHSAFLDQSQRKAYRGAPGRSSRLMMETLSLPVFFPIGAQWNTFPWFHRVPVGQGLWLFLSFSIVLFPGVDQMRNLDLIANSKFTAKTRNKI